MEKIRLQKYMAEAGVASRRKCEELIDQGRVKVNGEVVRTPGVKVDPAEDTVLVDGKPIKREKKVYLVLNKPEGYVCTKKDRHAEKTIYDLIPKELSVHSVGRLDKDTEGLILLTNDGALTQKLTHPSKKVYKIYRVVIQGELTQKEMNKLSDGVMIKEDDGSLYKTQKAAIRLIGKGRRTATYEVSISEGRKRQIRRMFDAVRHPVIHLKRIKEGNITLDGLKTGEWRYLKPQEIRELKK